MSDECTVQTSRHALPSFKEFMSTFNTIEPLSNFQIIDKCKELKIEKFKGVYMRDELNKNSKATSDECIILNHDHSSNNGTHWTALFIKNNICNYFDSYAFPPPEEIINYCSQFTERKYNSDRIQKIGEVICGHYCIFVLYCLSMGFNYLEILNELK